VQTVHCFFHCILLYLRSDKTYKDNCNGRRSSGEHIAVRTKSLGSTLGASGFRINPRWCQVTGPGKRFQNQRYKLLQVELGRRAASIWQQLPTKSSGIQRNDTSGALSRRPKHLRSVRGLSWWNQKRFQVKECYELQRSFFLPAKLQRTGFRLILSHCCVFVFARHMCINVKTTNLDIRQTFLWIGLFDALFHLNSFLSSCWLGSGLLVFESLKAWKASGPIKRWIQNTTGDKSAIPNDLTEGCLRCFYFNFAKLSSFILFQKTCLDQTLLGA